MSKEGTKERKEQKRLASRTYRKKNPLFNMLANARTRAKKQGVPFDLTMEYLQEILPTECPALGIPLVPRNGEHTGTGRPHDDSPSLDKIVPALGYVKDNVAIISHKANTIKSNATSDEIISVGTWLKSVE